MPVESASFKIPNAKDAGVDAVDHRGADDEPPSQILIQHKITLLFKSSFITRRLNQIVDALKALEPFQFPAVIFQKPGRGFVDALSQAKLRVAARPFRVALNLVE